jgi:hypothetical protein
MLANASVRRNVDKCPHRGLHLAEVERLKRTAEDIIEIGRDLIAVKVKLGHGNFGDWIKTEFDFSQETARKFMGVAEKFGDIPTLLEFKPAILYALAAPSTPESVRQEVIERDRPCLLHVDIRQHPPIPRTRGSFPENRRLRVVRTPVFS